MNRRVLVFLLLTAGVFSSNFASAQNDAGFSNDADAQVAAKALRQKLKDDGVIVDPAFQRRTLFLKRFNGNLENLRQLSERSPAGALSAKDVPHFTDETVAALIPNSEFDDVTLRGCPLTDAGLTALAKSKAIEYLRIEGCDITDQGLKTLQQMQQLKTIRIWDTKITADAVSDLQAALPECQVLADVIPTESATLASALRSSVLGTLLQGIDDAERKKELWRGLYAAHSEVAKHYQQELQNMRKLDSQFIKVLGEREVLLGQDKITPDMEDRINKGLNTIDRNDPRLTPIAVWLINRRERGWLKKHPNRVALLAHYMDVFTRPEN